MSWFDVAVQRIRRSSKTISEEALLGASCLSNRVILAAIATSCLILGWTGTARVAADEAVKRSDSAGNGEASETISLADLPKTTPLDQYVKTPDPSYRWKVVKSEVQDDMQIVVLDMVSQSWLSDDQVNRTEWQHWITCAIPRSNESRPVPETGFLMIGGGSNRGPAPEGPSEIVRRVARTTGSVVCELHMVPNQPLIFHDDGQRRVEDDLIGYTWDQYLTTGDANWLARNPMVKSAVKAMDTITAMMASETGGQRTVDKFVVAGGSKRGWTTWLTGAIDDRVVAIVPIVIDVLNVEASMRHHFAAYGYWAPAVGDYVQHRIMERMTHPRLKSAYQMIDPYYYRHRLKIPKFIVNAAGDQFFLPDSSQFYFDDLVGPKYLRYVPNADHGLDDTDALQSITAFYGLMLAGELPPRFSWTQETDGSFRITCDDIPEQVRLWHATNPNARDFRVETLGRAFTSETVDSADGRTYVANVSPPKDGWTAYFVELTYDVGMPFPLKLTTDVQVVPDVLPYADKPLDEPFSLTVVGVAPSAEVAQKAAATVQKLVESGEFQADQFQSDVKGTKCYFNWSPDQDQPENKAAALAKVLKDVGCHDIRYQLESGTGITR